MFTLQIIVIWEETKSIDYIPSWIWIESVLSDSVIHGLLADLIKKTKNKTTAPRLYLLCIFCKTSSCFSVSNHTGLHLLPAQFDFWLADQPVFTVTAGAFTSCCATLPPVAGRYKFSLRQRWGECLYPCSTSVPLNAPPQISESTSWFIWQHLFCNLNTNFKWERAFSIYIKQD